jgi:hypothetical protein
MFFRDLKPLLAMERNKCMVEKVLCVYATNQRKSTNPEGKEREEPDERTQSTNPEGKEREEPKERTQSTNPEGKERGGTQREEIDALKQKGEKCTCPNPNPKPRS